MLKLSPRLQLLLDSCLPGKPVWDVCCDHGLLGMKALESFPEVHFVDQVPEIIARLRPRVARYPHAFVHESAGENLGGVSGSLVIAGVGAATIFRILTGVRGAERLVLSPQKNERTFEADFARQVPGWALSPPRSVIESGRERPVWTADQSFTA